MVRAAQHADPVVLLQAVDFVQEVASAAWRYEAVYVFEDQQAWGGFAGFLEDAPDAVFGGVAREGFDVEAGDGVWAVAEGFH